LNLILASKEAVEVGIKNIGVDVFTNEVAEKMLEVVESYECEWHNQNLKVKPILNVCGYRMNR